MKFKLRFAGVGCAEVLFVFNNEKIKINVSYLSDFLYGYLHSLRDLVQISRRKAPDGIIYDTWYDEPGTFFWEYKLSDDDILSIKLTIDEGLMSQKPEKIIKVIEFEQDFRKFLKIIIKQIEKELRRSGIIGYSKNWNFAEFPFAAYLIIKLYLSDVKKHNNTVGSNFFAKSNLKRELKIINKLLINYSYDMDN